MSDILQEIMDMDFLDGCSFDLPDLPLSANGQESTDVNNNNSKILQCDVPVCAKASFTKPVHFRRHWAQRHMPQVLMYRCIIEGCDFNSVRDDKVREHITNRHFDAFVDDTDRVQQLRRLCQVIKDNVKYVDPKGVQPASYAGAILPPVISANARAVRIPAIHPSKAHPPCRKRKAEEPVDLSVRSDLLEIPLPNTKDGMLKEYFQIEHKLLVLQRRATALKRAIKVKEEQERRELLQERNQLRQQLAAQPPNLPAAPLVEERTLQQQLQDLKEEMRTKDRRIRHLEADQHRRF